MPKPQSQQEQRQPTAQTAPASSPKKKRDNTGSITPFRAAEMIENARQAQAKRITKLETELEAAKRDGGKREQEILRRVPEGERGQVQTLLDALDRKRNPEKPFTVSS